jgi:hypothetical protein
MRRGVVIPEGISELIGFVRDKGDVNEVFDSRKYRRGSGCAVACTVREATVSLPGNFSQPMVALLRLRGARFVMMWR